MSDLVLHRGERDCALALPQPRVAIHIRQAVQDDLPFIDQLQKKHTKMVGWFPTKQIEANIAGGHVLIAEAAIGNGQAAMGQVPTPPNADCRLPIAEPLGYCIARDKYMKREDCGIVYQLNVVPGEHRKLVGASLIKAVFERAAYGCRLFCCWCAQDIEANHFWESIGFVPLAFRTGARRSKALGPRIHIFWQRRVRAGDCETPYWFPSETSGGAVKENRVVLPIPPGTHWSDAKPAVLPGFSGLERAFSEREQKRLESDGEKRKRRSESRKAKVVKAATPAQVKGGLWFGPPPGAAKAQQKAEKVKAKKKPAQKNDPKLVAAARELRDRYMEQINAADSGWSLPPSACGRYDVSRALAPGSAAPPVMKVSRGDGDVPMLDAA